MRMVEVFQRIGPRARAIGAPIVLVLGFALIVRTLHQYHPIQSWLFWRYLGYWIAGLVVVGSGTIAGDAVVAWLLGGRRAPREQLVLAFAVGVFLFAMGVFLAGLLGLYGPAFFFSYPLALALPFARGFFRQYVRIARVACERLRAPRASLLWTVPVGAFCLALAYIPLMTPHNVSYDARWYHLPVAEHYAAEGAIRAFPEGWILGAYPQLGSLLYTWAMQLPFGRYFDRAELCQHIEWILFLGTLASVPELVRQLSPGLSGVGAGLVMFLFPGLYLYDSSLGGGGDHIVAALVPALWLALLRAWPRLEPRACAVFGLCLAATAMTKYTAALPVLPALLAFVIRVVWLALSNVRRAGVPFRRLLLGATVFGATFLIATAPHWLKNIAFYGDPLFPMLHEHVTPKQWMGEAKVHYDYFAQHTAAAAPRTVAGVKKTLVAAVNFAFEPNDWWSLHRDVPVFGFLFTTSLLLIPFLTRPWRIVGLVAAVEVGVLFWYWTHHLDRFLQALVPWMAAVTAAVFARVWRTHRNARGLVVAICGLQMVWAGDVPFFPTHLLGDTPYQTVARLVAEPRERASELHVSGWEDIGATLPRDAKIVIHNEHIHFGLERRSINDRPQFQTGLSYLELGSARAIYDRFKAWGVTHVSVPPQPSDIEVDSIAANLIFWDFFVNYTTNHQKIHGHTIAELPATPPPPAPTERMVAYLGCKKRGSYASGLYALTDLDRLYNQRRPKPRVPEPQGSIATIMNRAEFVVVEDCRRRDYRRFARQFSQIYRRFGARLYQRKP